MPARASIVRPVVLIGLVVTCAAAAAQTLAPSAPVVTEARRREVLEAARALTSEAFADVLRRAEAGDVEAQLLAGLAFEDAGAVPRDPAQAVRWISAAAESGHPMAQNVLGNYYASGTGVPRDSKKAVEMYSRAAAQGYAQAQANLGWAYLDGRDVAANPVEAVRLFRLAAEQGNARAQLALGLVHEYGKGVEKSAREAAAWYQKAAEQGDPDAQIILGLAYEKGNGVRKDKDEAAKWLRKASEQGHPIGSFQLGRLHLQKPGPGRTDPLATAVAVDSLKLSAEQGYPVAAFVLGEVFSYRLFPYHVRKDELEACTWYVIASGLDKPGLWDTAQPEAVAALRKDLPGRLDKIRKDIGSTQYAECERQASDWTTAHPRPRHE
jgi:TPR repeat protein